MNKSSKAWSQKPGAYDVPFRHVILDHWAEPELVRAAEAEWPDERWPFWHGYDNGKRATKDPLRFPPACAELIRRMLCLRVGELLGVDEAFGDWNCHAAGLHALPPGRALGRHLDSDHHPQTGWRRAANAVLSLNATWEPDWGGELELWNADGSACVQTIPPRFNRLMLFEPSDCAWHAVAPVRGPETRKTLAVYFWTRGGSGARQRSRAVFLGEESTERGN